MAQSRLRLVSLFRRPVPRIVILTSMLAFAAVAPHDAESEHNPAVDTARDITIGHQLVRQYRDHMTSTMAALAEGPGAHATDTCDQAALDRAQQLESSKLEAEIQLLRLQLEHAAVAKGGATATDIQESLLHGIQALERLQASRKAASPPGGPQPGEVAR